MDVHKQCKKEVRFGAPQQLLPHLNFQSQEEPKHRDYAIVFRLQRH